MRQTQLIAPGHIAARVQEHVAATDADPLAGSITASSWTTTWCAVYMLLRNMNTQTNDNELCPRDALDVYVDASRRVLSYDIDRDRFTDAVLVRDAKSCRLGSLELTEDILVLRHLAPM